MQTLFAFDQCREANNDLAQDFIKERFTPDLNSMEVQDKVVLKQQKKEAVSLYLEKFENPTSKKSEDSKVNATVKEALKLVQNSTKKDFSFLKKNLVIEVEKINHWYYSVLGLLLSFEELAASDKKTDFSNFSNNGFIKALKNDASLQSVLLKTNATWINDRTLIQGWFKDVIKTDNTFQEYCNEQTPNEESERGIIKHLVRRLILGDTIINDYFAEHDIRWAEDHDIVKSLVDKTLKSLHAKTGAIQLQKLSMDWEDDLIFMDILFEKTAQIDPAHKKLIAANTKNWEVDRLPLLDRVILEMAITELINFPAIPVKVTINEYIELTKHYSTPKSAKFVNGILDVIAKELVSTGVVKKSGRGLIDNK
jgi:N utilization substance protein B